MKKIGIIISVIALLLILTIGVFAAEATGKTLNTSALSANPTIDGVISTNEYKGAAVYTISGNSLIYYGHKNAMTELWIDNNLFMRTRLGDSKVYIGWTGNGLYVAFDIADTTISKNSFNSSYYNTFLFGNDTTNGFVGDTVTLLLRTNGDGINNTQNAGEGGYQNMIAFTAVPFPQQQSNEQVGRSGKYSPIVFETWLTHSKLNVNVAAKGDANGYVVEYYIPFSTMSALTTSKGASESYSFSGMDNFANGKELYFSILLSDGVDWTTLIVTDSSTFDASAMDGFSLEDESQDKTPAEVKQTLNSFTKEVNKLHFVQSVDCTVSFETFDGGTISSFVVDSGTSVDLTKYTASKKGYTFIGWCNDINCQNLVSEPVVSANTTFYAKYEKDKVVSFATGNGSKVDSITVPYGNTIDVTQYTTEETGYKFLGWYDDTYYTNEVKSLKVEKDTTLYARFQKLLVVKFETFGGTTYSDLYFESGNVLNLSSYKPTLKDSEFNGWYLDKNFKNKVSIFTVTSDTTLYAKFIPKYTVTFNVGSGSAISPVTLVEGSTLDLSSYKPTLSGCAFKGWYTENTFTNKVESIVVTKNTTLYAKFVGQFTLSFSTGYGSAISSITIESGESVDLSKYVTTRSGYEFAGWYTESNYINKVTSITPISHTTVYAKWERHFTLSFNTDVGSKINSISVLEGDTINLGNYTTSASGYYFDGWYTDSGYKNKVTSVTISKNTQLYAKFIKYYTLTFSTGNGSKVEQITILDGSVIDLSKYSSTLENNYFTGWYTDSTLKTKITSITISKNTILYAGFEKYPVLTFITGSGSAISSLTVEKGKTIDLTKYTSSLNGYKFDGWYSDNNYTTKITSITVNKNTSVYAKFIKYYNVTFVTNGGSAVNKLTVLDGTVVDLTKYTSEKNENTFLGWSLDTTYVSTVKSIIVSKDITVYANFDKYKVVTFATGNGSVVSSLSVPTGTVVNLNNYTSTLNGFKFDGWYVDGNKVTSITVNKDTTVSAKFLEYFTLTFNTGNGSKVNSLKVLDGDVVDLSKYSSTLNNNYFMGWYTDATLSTEIKSVKMSKNTTVFAGFEQYPTLTFVTSGSTVNSLTLQKGQTVDLSKYTSSKNGFKFDGWYLDDKYTSKATTVTVNKSIKVYAKFIEYFTLTFNTGSGSAVNSISILDGESVDLSKYSSTLKNNYFMGWYTDEALSTEIKNIKISKNTTVYAGFESYPKLEFVTGNGSKINSLSLEKNQSVDLTKYTSSLEGYKFDGWYLESTFDTKVTSIKMEKSTKVYAKFIKYYSVTFITDGSGVDKLSVLDGQEVDLGQYKSTKNNSVFHGWYLDDKYTNKAEKIVVNSNVVLYARFETYLELSFETYNGTSVDAIVLERGYTVDLTKYSTTLDGYVFDGWYTDKEYTNKVESITPYENVKVYAKFLGYYDVTFITGNGTGVEKLTLLEGSELNLAPYVSSLNGSSFNGWYLDENYLTKVEKIVIKDNTVLFAKFTSNIVFKDVDKETWYYDAVYWAVEKGITNGNTKTRFSPDENCTRGQIVTFLWRAAGCPEPSSTSNPFKDITSEDYFYKAVLWAVESGITKGTDNTHFKPEAPCMREEAVTFLYRAAGKPEVKSSNKFKDVGEKAYYYDAVLWAVENGITNGTTKTRFSPKEYCTRAQIVTFLYRNR